MAGPTPAPGVAPRLAATRVLVAVMAQGRSLKAELAQALPALPDPRDRALVEAICLGVLRRHPAYEAALAQWLQRRLTPRDADLKALLLAGFAQIDALQLPPHAALSATVETCRALGRPSQAGMVNALLRRALREGFPAVAADATWPGWLRRQVRADWGAAAEDVFVASAQPAPMWLRVNARQGDVEEYQQALAAQQIAAQRVPWLAQGLRLDEPVPVAQLPGFAQGQVSVQDGSAQQVADALALSPGARVLDACAAPGGKSAHLLERDAALRLTALDVDARRLRQVQQTLDRVLPGAQVQLHAADAADLSAWWDGQPFDAVLLDAPCSATGIVRRQPDVLLHRRVHDVEALVALQARLLDALWRSVRPGGQLLYTTCSILACENHAQVEAFLARTPDAVASALPDTFGRASGGGRQRLPGEDGCDGFFYARLSKAA